MLNEPSSTLRAAASPRCSPPSDENHGPPSPGAFFASGGGRSGSGLPPLDSGVGLHDAGAFCLPAALLEPEKEDLHGAGAKGPLDEAAPLVLVEELIEQVVDVAVDSSGLFPEDICAVRQCKVHGGAVAG